MDMRLVMKFVTQKGKWHKKEQTKLTTRIYLQNVLSQNLYFYYTILLTVRCTCKLYLQQTMNVSYYGIT